MKERTSLLTTADAYCGGINAFFKSSYNFDKLLRCLLFVLPKQTQRL